MSEYEAFLKRRMALPSADGIDGAELMPHLFDHQRDLVLWALRIGRSCIFADTGLGKTAMQLEWARVVSEQRGRVLLLAPLAVADQTVREGERFGVPCAYRRDDAGDAITVTNYEMLDRFDPAEFAGVVLDESSILKSYTGATRNAIINSFRNTPFKLACTATPAPNDHMELGNHAEFVGVKSRVEMLAEYFVHDGGSTQSWRLKGHAKGVFWKWVCSWAAMVRRPSDLGYDDGAYSLPELRQHTVNIAVDHGAAQEQGMLFADDARTLTDQRRARKSTVPQRVEAIAAMVASEPDEPAIVWCEYNAEADAVTAAIDGAVQVAGSDSPEAKLDRLLGFADGKYRVLVTKPSIAGFGMNWQHCARVYFVGPSHSYEQTYQAIRRCWRFGQTRPVDVFTCVAENERAVLASLNRKAEAADEMSEAMMRHVNRAAYETGKGARSRWDNYSADQTMEIQAWLSAQPK